MTTGSRIFVLFIFALFGLSFIATTAILAYEFPQGDLWLDFLTMDSHLFLFFPTCAIIALVAFYLPSVAIVDLYWHHLTLGRIRFMFGALVIIAASWAISALILSGKNVPIWNIKPDVMHADLGEPANCLKSRGDCARLPIVAAVKNLRDVSRSRQSLRPLVRECLSDPLIERHTNTGPKRYCVVTTPYSPNPELKSDEECCRAQEAFLTKVSSLQEMDQPAEEMTQIERFLLPLKIFEPEATMARRSLTSLVHGLFLPLKVWFLLTLVAISILMTVHLRKIEVNYKSYLTRIETGLLIGTFSALLFPLMSQAFLQSVDAMFGDLGRGNFSNIVPIMSFAFGVWTLLILLYFYRRADKETETFAKIGGAAGGIVALIQYQSIVDFLVSTVGSGAEWYVIVAAAVVVPVLAFIVLSLMMNPAMNAETSEQ